MSPFPRMLVLPLFISVAIVISGCHVPVHDIRGATPPIPQPVPAPLPTSAVDSRADPFIGSQANCIPEFPDHAGWFGADAAYSIPLSIPQSTPRSVDESRVSLWLFGDSFVAHPESPSRRAYPFVHNSIGLSRCDPSGTWTIETFWQKDAYPAPRAFFRPDPKSKWVKQATQDTGAAPFYWLFDGFVVHDVLFVGLLRVARAAPRGAFNLPFELLGMDLARVENFREPPAQWKIQISEFSDDRRAMPGSAFVTTPSHLYAFAFLDREDGHSPRMLGRLRIGAFRKWDPDLRDNFEYFSTQRTWKKGFDPGDAAILMEDDASEMSIHFDSRSQTWLAIYSELSRDDEETFKNRSATISYRRADRLEGPWSSPNPLLAIPELDSVKASAIPDNLFCYAGKAHPQFTSADEILVTYTCNLFSQSPESATETLLQLLERTDLYRPRALKVSLPPRTLPLD